MGVGYMDNDLMKIETAGASQFSKSEEKSVLNMNGKLPNITAFVSAMVWLSRVLGVTTSPSPVRYL